MCTYTGPTGMSSLGLLSPGLWMCPSAILSWALMRHRQWLLSHEIVCIIVLLLFLTSLFINTALVTWMKRVYLFLYLFPYLFQFYSPDFNVSLVSFFQLRALLMSSSRNGRCCWLRLLD